MPRQACWAGPEGVLGAFRLLLRKNAHLQAGDVVVGAAFAALIDDVGREHTVIHRQSPALSLLEQLVDGALYAQIRPVMVAAEIVPGRDICHRLLSCNIRQAMHFYGLLVIQISTEPFARALIKADRWIEIEQLVREQIDLLTDVKIYIYS